MTIRLRCSQVQPAHSLHPPNDPHRTIRSVCVYCGSADGYDPAYAKAAAQLGAALAKADIALVYGGGREGLMGITAKAALDAGGHVIGIVPSFLASRIRFLEGTHDLLVVETMHARKQQMFERADAFVALPGGLGTLEELVEQMTWHKLDRHRKPLFLADVNGFWKPLVALLDHMNAHGFLHADASNRTSVCQSVDDIIAALTSPEVSLRRSPQPVDLGPLSNSAYLRPKIEADDCPSQDENARHDVYDLHLGPR